MLVKVFTAGPVATHAYLIGCPTTQEAAILDAPQGSAALILKEVERLQLVVKMILITHSHWDHIADAAKLKKILNVPLYIHSADQKNLAEPGSDGLPLFFSIEGVKPDRLVKEGDRLHIGSLELEVIETPGHTPGGICLWLPKEKVLFSGDTLFQGSIGNVSFPTASPSLMRDSLKKLAKLPLETKVYPGHGAPTTIGAELGLVRE